MAPLLFQYRRVDPCASCGCAAGVSALASFVDAVSFPVIGACNMDLSAEPSLAGIQKWAVFDLPAGKVALLGYIAQDTAGLTSAGGVTFSDPVRASPA